MGFSMVFHLHVKVYPRVPCFGPQTPSSVFQEFGADGSAEDSPESPADTEGRRRNGRPHDSLNYTACLLNIIYIYTYVCVYVYIYIHDYICVCIHNTYVHVYMSCILV